MSYNPNRQKNAAVKRQRRLDPRAGTRYSDVVSRFGPRAATISDVRSKVNTPRGWRVEIHKGEFFEMIYEFICARNATGVIKNDDQDRAIRVLSGSIFVTVGSEVFELTTGSSYAFPKGTEYQLSTAGDFDSEVVFCQGPDYEEMIEQLTPPDAVNVSTSIKLPDEIRSSLPKVDRDKAQMHAERIQADRKARDHRRKQALVDPSSEESVAAPAEVATADEGDAPVKKTPPPPRGHTPLSGQSVEGVNPRPIGAGGYHD